MRSLPRCPDSLLVLAVIGARPVHAQAPRGVVLADLTWNEAEKVLAPDAVVVIPLGAQAKEHGPHLRLDNDFQLAEYFRAGCSPRRQSSWRRRSTTTSIRRSSSTRGRRICASRRHAT